MSVYLHDIPLHEAQARLKQALQAAGLWRVLGAQSIPLDEHALGRVTAQTIWARASSPHYHASAMDGFAVRAQTTNRAMPSQPVALELGPDASYVDTGDPVPSWANAVIPIENVEALDALGNISADVRDPFAIRIRAAVAPWSHIRPLGEDIVVTQLVLPAGHVLRPADLGAIAASGHTDIPVARKPRVAILPTGSELVPLGSPLAAGDILEYNSLVLAAQVRSMGGEPFRFPIIQDDADLICEHVRKAAQDHDLILLNAGSSAGAEDFSAKVVEQIGTVLVHGVAVRPGHPVILGMIDKGSVDLAPDAPRSTPILGVPGYPVSAALTVDIFVEPLLSRWLGRRPYETPVETATLTRKIVSPPGDDDYVRVALGKVGDRLLAAPLSRGAGVITSLVQADGLALIPRGVQGLDAGEPISVQLYRSRGEVERTIFCIGSHDLTLDLLSQFLAARDRRLSSANVGSQGGLIALRRGEAHLAGCHLLDPETGKYNISSIRRYLPGMAVKLIALVGREQGLMVKRGNPKHVNSLADLTRPEVLFVNRQRGAGTRVLLDYHLSQMSMAPEQIAGYFQEEYTHLGVATAIASGRADCGLGIAAAAQALDLDFLPLFQERYELVIPKQIAESELLIPLFDVLADSQFRASVARMSGYDVSRMGSVVLED